MVASDHFLAISRQRPPKSPLLKSILARPPAKLFETGVQVGCNTIPTGRPDGGGGGRTAAHRCDLPYCERETDLKIGTMDERGGVGWIDLPTQRDGALGGGLT